MYCRPFRIRSPGTPMVRRQTPAYMIHLSGSHLPAWLGCVRRGPHPGYENTPGELRRFDVRCAAQGNCRFIAGTCVLSLVAAIDLRTLTADSVSRQPGPCADPRTSAGIPRPGIQGSPS